jgi:hypothetical protein
MYCCIPSSRGVITASVIQHPILVVDPFSSFLYCSYSILQRGVITASVIQHPILVVDPFSSFLYCSYSFLQRGVITASVIQHPILVVDPFSSFLYCSYSILQRGDYSFCYLTSNSSCRSPLFRALLFLFHPPEG